MKIMNVKWFGGILLVAIALTGPACNRGKTTEKVQALPEQTKRVEEYKKGLAESSKIVIAKVNGTDITMKDLINEMNQIALKYISDIKQKTPELDNKIKQEALDILIFKELAVQEALKQGMKVGPEAVALARQQIKTGLGSDEGYRKYLENLGFNEASLGRQIERDKLFETIVAKEIFQKVKTDEKLVRAIYQKEQEKYIFPESIAVDDVYFPVSKDLETSMKKAEETLALLKKNNNDISKLAQDKALIVRSGNVAQQEYPNIFQAALNMKTGELSAVIREEDGLHIVKFMHKISSRKMSFEEARETIEQKMNQPHIEKHKTDWEKGLKKNAKIEIMLAEVEKKLREEAQKQKK